MKVLILIKKKDSKYIIHIIQENHTFHNNLEILREISIFIKRIFGILRNIEKTNYR